MFNAFNNIVLIGTEMHNLGLDCVKFMIGSRCYTYEMNRNILKRIEYLAVHRPGAALNIAKKHGKLINKREKL